MHIPLPPGVSQLGIPAGSPLHQPVVRRPVAPPSNIPPEASMDRAVNYYADYSGCGHWRMIWPESVLNSHQKLVVHGTTMMVLDERWYVNTKTVRVQRQATEHQLKFIKLMKDFQKRQHFNIVYEIDDLVFHEDIPDYNKFKSAFVNPVIRESACAIMSEVDEITVTCKFMADYYKEKTGNKNITVIPNYPPKWWIGNFYDPAEIARRYHKHRKKPRIIYPASGAHFDVDNRVNQRDDFFHVNDVIRKTVNKYQWVFVGAYPLTLQDLVASGKIEFHPWQRLLEYPALLHGLEPNMLIAPLEDNTFNKAKSDLKYIEACCYGIPIACQDLCTYEEAPYRFKTGDEMMDHIRYCLKNKNTYMQISKASRAVADKRWLELDSNIDKYVELYRHPYKHPERKLLNSLAANQ
tara:strand:+ start:611 stop:1834 length:1224 start_codon:yes stop_codon:yes gene_type:complete